MHKRALSFFLCLILAVPSGWATDGAVTHAPDAITPEATVQRTIIAAPVGMEIPAAGEATGANKSTGAATSPAGPAEPLTEGEEEQLQARAEEPGQEVAGGALSNQHLTYAVIALAAIALVLIVK